MKYHAAWHFFNVPRKKAGITGSAQAPAAMLKEWREQSTGTGMPEGTKAVIYRKGIITAANVRAHVREWSVNTEYDLRYEAQTYAHLCGNGGKHE